MAGGAASITQVMHKLRDGRTLYEEPKSAKGKRRVALSPTTVLALRAHSERAEADRELIGVPLAGTDLVFARADGSPMLPDTLTHGFKKIARRAGFDNVSLHDARHTHASLMLAQGVHPKIVQERLEHSTIAVTLDTYSHVLPGLQEEAALKFEDSVAEPVAETVG